jgi:putative polyhydroxyalkanoate system protein
MSSIHLKHHHSLSRDETRKRVESIAEDLKREYKMDYSWDGDRVRFKRTGASGSVLLGEDFIELEIKLGMLLAPLKGKIEDTIRRDISSRLA